ncbi:CvpA family protein [bacterium]|nr:CvpA family protein [bacterium]
MENKKENTDFINFGTYRGEEADILKYELEKQGIPVKVIYPGTDVGTETAAQAYFPAYKLMIRTSDFQKAKELREEFNIKPIGAGEKMPVPKIYVWAKRGLNRYSLIGWVISLIGLYMSSYLAAKFEFFAEEAPFYFSIAFSIFFLLWLCTTIYSIFKEKRRH